MSQPRKDAWEHPPSRLPPDCHQHTHTKHSCLLSGPSPTSPTRQAPRRPWPFTSPTRETTQPLAGCLEGRRSSVSAQHHGHLSPGKANCGQHVPQACVWLRECLSTPPLWVSTCPANLPESYPIFSHLGLLPSTVLLFPLPLSLHEHLLTTAVTQLQSPNRLPTPGGPPPRPLPWPALARSAPKPPAAPLPGQEPRTTFPVPQCAL